MVLFSFSKAMHLYLIGETVDMTHVVRGVDSNGVLLVDVVLTGEVPYLPPGSVITLQPYSGEYTYYRASYLIYVIYFVRIYCLLPSYVCEH